MPNDKPLPSVNLTTNTSLQMTHVVAQGNNHGGVFGTGAQLSHNITPNLSAHLGANVTRAQSFHGYGGQTGGGANIGFKFKF